MNTAPLRQLPADSWLTIAQSGLPAKFQGMLEMDTRIKLYNFIHVDMEYPLFHADKKFIYIPCGEIPRIEHEISHWLEMTNESRWFLPNLGMKFLDSPEEMGPKKFWAAYRREVKVRAIQAIINESKTLRMFSHSFWGSEIKKNLGHGCFQTEEHVEQWENDIIIETQKEFTIDKIYHEWARRIHAWQNYAETKLAKLCRETEGFSTLL